MKKTGWLVAISAIAMMAGVSAAQAKITWWSWNWDSAWQEETWTAKAKEFTEQTGIEVEIRTMPWNELAPGIQTSSSANRAGDVVMVPHSEYAWLARAGLLTDITSVYPNIDPDDFVPATLKGMDESGKYYGVPTRRAGYALVYNESILAKAGITEPPKTLEELLADAKLIAEKVPDAYAWGMPLMPAGNAFNRWENIFFSYGGEWLNADKSDLAPEFEAAAKAAFQFHQDIAPYTPPSRLEDTNDDLLRLAAQGVVGIWQNTLSSVSTMAEVTAPDLLPSVKYSLFPAGLEGNEGVTSVNGWDIVIPATAANPDEAIKFVEWWTTSQNMGDTELTLPARVSALEHPRIAAYPPAFLSGNGKDTLSEAWAADIRGVVWDQLQGVVLGEVSADDATAAVAEAVRAAIAKS